MAGNKLKRRDAEMIEASGGEELIGQMILDGYSIRDIMRALGVSNGGYYRWLRSDPERPARIEDLRRTRAEILDIEGLEIVDSLAEKPSAMISREDIALAKLRAEQRRYVASQIDPDRRNQGNKLEVNLTVGALHLEALKAHGDARGGPPVLEAEIVSDGD